MKLNFVVKREKGELPMGSIKKILTKISLPDREKHNSRLFVDLGENIHIHHREFRSVFSLDEFFEYVDIISASAKDIRNYIFQNPRYKEGKIPDTIVIAGGKERQLQFLVNSPKPDRSYYFNNDFSIELQDEFVTDEIHVHLRDFRIVMNRENFKSIAKEFEKALNALENFEKNHNYLRHFHPDREIINFNNANLYQNYETKLMGIKKVKIDKIKSFDFPNKHYKPSIFVMNILKKGYEENKKIFPILLSKESDGTHLIIDGHHRYALARELGFTEVDCIISDMTYEQSAELRKVEALLKEIDKKTDFKYYFSDFYKEFIAFKLNFYYRNSFALLTKKHRFFWKLLRKFKRLVFGKNHIFANFNEAYRKNK